MKIEKVTPRGYCKGVIRAIQIAKDSVKQFPNTQIYILGMLVHNHYVIEALRAYGIISLDDHHLSREELLDTIETGVVIFSAHGVSEAVKQKAKQKGLICIDASCPDVLKTQALVQQYNRDDYHVFYIGKKGHPEAEAICDRNPNVTLIQNSMDIPTLPITQKIFVTNQTTMSFYDVEQIFNDIKNIYPQAIFTEEICLATRVRQEAIAKLQNVDCLLIVGDKNSNNSNRLAQIGKSHNISKVYLIDDVNDLQTMDFTNIQHIAISSGASTPTYLTNQVIAYLAENQSGKQNIDISKIL